MYYKRANSFLAKFTLHKRPAWKNGHWVSAWVSQKDGSIIFSIRKSFNEGYESKWT